MTTRLEISEMIDEVKNSFTPFALLRSYYESQPQKITLAEDLNEIIKGRFRCHYQNFWDMDLGRKITKENYVKWCNKFGINSDPNFPDW